ncbi:hypothetical protein J3A83DRAFT_236809 [Scleroderma citrinum]
MAISSDFQVKCVHEHQSTDGTQVDTRRFGTVFDADTPESESVDCGDDSGEDDDCTASESQWEFHATVHTGGFEASGARAGGDADESCSSSISAAQQVIEYYRSSQLDKEQPRSAREKDLSSFPNDQHSMITLNPVEPSSPMDLTWRPPLKVHVHPSTKRELDYALKQAHDMIRNAGLLPEDRIQCRRYGCRNILDNVEALKYHLHFHNIEDTPQSQARPSVDGSVEDASTIHPTIHSTHTNQKTRKSSAHTLTSNAAAPYKSILENSDHSHSRQPSVSVLRKLSIGGGHRRGPSTSSDTKTVEIFSPRAAQANLLNLTVLANTVDSTRSKSPPPVTPVSPNRGRRSRARARTMSNNSGPKGPGYNASISALISPPSSPGPPSLTTCTKTIMSAQTNLSLALPAHDSGVFIQAGEAVPHLKGEGEKAKSPSRARSPIRDGLKRVLSFGLVYD